MGTTTSALAHYWHPVATSEAVGDHPIRCELLEEQLVVFRIDGRVAAFRDLCIHRGTALSLGWVSEGVLTCPYHGWQYDVEGKCVHIPSLAPGKPIPPRARAQTYQAKEAYGLVWVTLDEHPAPLPPPGPFVWEEPGYRSIALGPYEWKASAGRAAENVLDFSHFPWVHENVLGVRTRSEVAPHDVRRTEDGLEYIYEQMRPGSPHNNYREDKVRNEYRVVLPFVVHDRKRVLSDGSDTVMAFIACPVGPNRTALFTTVSRNYKLDESDDFIVVFTDKVFSQDQAIVESQRPELLPLDLREELHLKVADNASMVYRRALEELADEDSGYF